MYGTRTFSHPRPSPLSPGTWSVVWLTYEVFPPQGKRKQRNHGIRRVIGGIMPSQDAVCMPVLGCNPQSSDPTTS